MAAMESPATCHADAPLRWDIFCRVIDNFGDIGVCWRLCADLASRGHQVRLWVDDASALAWMAPRALTGGWAGIEVMPWNAAMDPQRLENIAPSDVWVEGFGCEIAPEFIAACVSNSGARGQFDAQVPVWVNLEYLSAEPYVERSHGLPSPVMSGPAKGRAKHFYYPGFTGRTGGLLREIDLEQRQQSFDAAQWLQKMGIARRPQETLVSLFCYEPPALASLVGLWADGDQPTHLLVTPGRAAAAVLAVIAHKNGLEPLWNKRRALSISYLPQLSQTDYDHLLWSCDLNCVRGEDSLVRALWAGKPLLWQIYPQADAAHHAKLESFLDWLGADDNQRAWHRVWNSAEMPAPDLPNWHALVTRARAHLPQTTDLCASLIDFVQKNR